MIKLLDKYRIAILTFVIFTTTGAIVWLIRDYRYFILFVMIGLADGFARLMVKEYPGLRQVFRKVLICALGGFMFIWLSLVIGVNFQFPQLFFDAFEGIMAGALIQLVIARIVLPFFAGNAFCSRACWNGAVFEFTNEKSRSKRVPIPRSNLLAWGYVLAIAVLAIYIAINHNPATDIALRRQWIIWENVFITATGIVLTWFAGSRAYCRLICPFLTISGLISPWSVLKITPIKAEKCTACNRCSKACPMLIDVLRYVHDNKRVNDRTCILCEKCVSSCPENVLEVATGGKGNDEEVIG
ncbi:MAG: 4Fe-4S dicluster domain-containing protein [Bacteroidales bacterium]|nr:4Fe-4S dicluster domain-containing protein [Bacteroidales bacterium]MCF8458317.1 4Fe-4S dicluster domain-containing protein [Bacteroidales bacterium]